MRDGTEACPEGRARPQQRTELRAVLCAALRPPLRPRRGVARARCGRACGDGRSRGGGPQRETSVCCLCLGAMVQLYNLHPFGSQRVVPCKQEPAQFCCGHDVLFVASAAASCGVEVFAVRREGRCEPLGSFATLGPVLRMAHSRAGQCLPSLSARGRSSTGRARVAFARAVLGAAARPGPSPQRK